MMQLIFAVMILTIIYAASTFNVGLVILAWWGGTWLLIWLGIEREVRAA